MILPTNDAITQDKLSADAIKEHLEGVGVYLFEEIDSTSSEARRRITAGERGTFLVLAEGQTAGRGRQGKSFYSPAGGGIYMTLAIPAAGAPADVVCATTAAAVAVYSAILAQTGIETDIKWVNDLYWNEKKVAGILAEAVLDHTGALTHILIGVGLNYGTVTFPTELAEIATSLSCEMRGRDGMIAAIARELLTTLQKPMADYLPLYRARSMVLGKDITYTQNGATYEARAVDIDENGGLVVLHTDGTCLTLQSGEISLRLA
jgi:BirA family biotin operon repressor/biotin-[acetyl-CoA-carboxylase] ligase